MLFLGLPTAAETHPVLGVAEELIRRGFRVTYATTGPMAQHVRAIGAEVLLYSQELLPAVRAHFHEQDEGSRPGVIVHQPATAVAARTLARDWDVSVIGVHTGPAAVEPGELREPEEPAVVFVPRAFQPEQQLFGDEFAFVGPSVDGQFYSGAHWTPPTGELPVLLVSPDGLAGLLELCVEAFANQPWHVVLPAAPDQTIPANFERQGGVPALAVLRHTRVLLCGGSSSSVLSAAHQGVPVIVVPQSAEQRMVAEQVTALGLGRVLGTTPTAAELREAVRAVIEDDAVIAGARRMQRVVRQAGGTGGAADVIESCLHFD